MQLGWHINNGGGVVKYEYYDNPQLLMKKNVNLMISSLHESIYSATSVFHLLYYFLIEQELRTRYSENSRRVRKASEPSGIDSLIFYELAALALRPAGS